MRGSSVNFKKVTSAIHSVSHANRDVPPDYLLPEGMSQGAHVVIDDAGEVQKTLTHKMSLASGRAKASKDFSPLWEGVINLPAPSKNITTQHQIEIVKAWCVEYEKLTGHKVLRADVHLDEGYIDEAGKPQYNAHAHVMTDRTTDKGRVIKLSPPQLRAVQNMTAEVTSLERGKDARTTGRKHLGHQNFKYLAERGRLENQKHLDGEKAKTALEGRLTEGLSRSLGDTKTKLKKAQTQAAKVPQLEAQVSTQATEIAKINEQYRLDREAMKTSGEAKQADYQKLKKEHEAVLAKLASTEAKLVTVQALADQVPALEAKLASVKANQKITTTEKVKNEPSPNKSNPRPKHPTRREDRLYDLSECLLDTVGLRGEAEPAKLLPEARRDDLGQPKQEAVGDRLRRAERPSVAPKVAQTAFEAPKPQTLPTPSPTPQKSPEPVFPRLTEQEFEELDAKVWGISPKAHAAARDVLVGGLLVAAAALLQKIMPGSVIRAIEKLLGNYIAPVPPSIQKDPPKVVTPAPKAPGRGGVGR